MKKILLPILVPLLLICACKKEEDLQAVKGPYATLDDLFNELQPKSRKVTMNAGSGGSFQGIGGTRFVFAPNTLETLEGVAVSGNVDIELLECLTPGDMICSGILPMSNGLPLISGGELLVKVTQNGHELRLKPGSTFEANLPTNNGAARAGMSVFYGTETGISRNKVNWSMIVDSAGSGKIIYNGDTIRLISDSLEYVNVDKFMSNPDFQTINLNITGLDPKVSAKDIITYVIYDDYNGVTTADGSYAGGTLSGARSPRIRVHFAVFSIVDGNFYGGTSASLVPSTGSSYPVPMSLMSPAAFKSLLDTF